MSTVAFPTPSGLPRGRGGGEHKGRAAGKGRTRNTHGQLENRRVAHPGKSAAGGGVPVATPRKPLSLIDSNTKTPLPVPAGKGHSSVASQRKPERKNAPARSQRPKQTTSQVARDVTAAVSASSTTDQEMETLPEIETMSRRAEEPDELDIGEVFVPPAYFSGLMAALKQPLVPPLWTLSSSTSSAPASFPSESDNPFRPDTPPIDCDLPYTREELNLPDALPDIDFW